MTTKKRNLSVRGPSIWTSQPCPKCERNSKPLENIKLLQAATMTVKDGEGIEIVKVPHTAKADMELYCRHCKTPLFSGIGYFHLKRVEYVEKE